MSTVNRVYDTYAQARAALIAVEAAGIPASDVSMVANRNVSAEYDDVDEVNTTAAGAGIGGALGGGAGLLAGLGLIAIPGIGPVVAAGWLAATAAGAAAGATAGGIVGALTGAGEPEQNANVYSESIRRGGTLVTARVPDARAAEIQGILDTYKPVDPETRAAEYRSQGWKTFDPAAPAYKPSDSDIERIRREWPDKPDRR